MLQDGLDGQHGLPRARLAELAGRFAAVQDEVRHRRGAGENEFYHLVDQGPTVRQTTTFAEGLGQAYDHVLVLGIGGSALGTKALLNALRRPAWNEWTTRARALSPWSPCWRTWTRRRWPRRWPASIRGASGERDQQVRRHRGDHGAVLGGARVLESVLGDATSRHLVFTTDPTRGALRELAARDAIATLDVPPAVGGRFSVLSPVGLLPAALAGIDITALLAGARRAMERTTADDLLRNPAALYAAMHWAADTDLGARIHVLMPYTDRLRELAEWFRQLWAESLGKRLDRAGRTVHVGPTPVAAVGATDQHSQVQLFMEGPFDKVITFVRLERFGDDLPIPAGPALPADLAYLPGHTLGELLNAEYEATSSALAEMGRMNCTLRLPELTPDSLGELIMFFQLATGYAGVWYGIDPFDQPGVELGKRLTYAAMGRPGYESAPRAPAPPDEA